MSLAYVGMMFGEFFSCISSLEIQHELPRNYRQIVVAKWLQFNGGVKVSWATIMHEIAYLL